MAVFSSRSILRLRNLKRLLLVILICLVVLKTATARDAPVVSGRVLLLNSYHKGYLWTDNITRGVEETLAGHNVELHIEYMDTKRQFGELYRVYLSRLLSLKHTNHKYDAVITSDDNAFDYFLENKTALTGQSPHIFCGTNYLEPDRIKNLSHITGINEQADLAANIDLIKQFHPETSTVLVITDNTTTGKSVQKELERLRHKDWGALSLELIYDVSMDELGARLRGLEPGTVVLYTFFFRDKNNTFFHCCPKTDFR